MPFCLGAMGDRAACLSPVSKNMGCTMASVTWYYQNKYHFDSHISFYLWWHSASCYKEAQVWWETQESSKHYKEDDDIEVAQCLKKIKKERSNGQNKSQTTKTEMFTMMVTSSLLLCKK